MIEQVQQGRAPLTLLTWLHAWPAIISLAGLAVCGLYALYVAKVHLGIDIFPAWGLHLPGPRSLARIIARKLGPQ